MQEKLVITGMGAVTPIGIGVDTYWNNLVDGKCGIDHITRFDASELLRSIVLYPRSLLFQLCLHIFQEVPDIAYLFFLKVQFLS